MGAPSHQLPSHLTLRSQHLLRGCDLHLGLASEGLPWSLCLKTKLLLCLQLLVCFQNQIKYIERDGTGHSNQAAGTAR